MGPCVVLSSRERWAWTILTLLVPVVVLADISIRTWNKTRDLTELQPRLVFTSGSLMDPDSDPGLVVDHRLDTAWVETVPSDLRQGGSGTGALPEPGSLFLQMELSLSHFPGSPPKPNPVRSITIWSGDPRAFYQHARPRRVSLRFFIQKLVDVDREFRFPSLPENWSVTTILLEDRPGPQKIPVQLPVIGPASGAFPSGIAQIWLRIDIESVYPGTASPQKIAMAEVDFEETYSTHEPMR